MRSRRSPAAATASRSIRSSGCRASATWRARPTRSSTRSPPTRSAFRGAGTRRPRARRSCSRRPSAGCTRRRTRTRTTAAPSATARGSRRSLAWSGAGTRPVHTRSRTEPVNAGECDPAGTANAVLCPAKSYATGGPGFPRFARSIATRRVGPHAPRRARRPPRRQDRRGGRLQPVRQPARLLGGHRPSRDPSGTSFSDYRNYSYLTAPDQRVQLNNLHWVTHSFYGGRVRAGQLVDLRQGDAQRGRSLRLAGLFGGDGQVAVTMPNQLSPRVCLVWDPTQKGRSKIYGNYALLPGDPAQHRRPRRLE